MTGKAADGTTVTPIRQKMIDQMQIAGLAERTQAIYIGEIEQLARHLHDLAGRPRCRPAARLGSARH